MLCNFLHKKLIFFKKTRYTKSTFLKTYKNSLSYIMYNNKNKTRVDPSSAKIQQA